MSGCPCRDAQATPRRARLSASLPPEVKTISFGARAEERRGQLARLLDRFAGLAARGCRCCSRSRTGRPGTAASPPAPRGPASWSPRGPGRSSSAPAFLARVVVLFQPGHLDGFQLALIRALGSSSNSSSSVTHRWRSVKRTASGSVSGNFSCSAMPVLRSPSLASLYQTSRGGVRSSGVQCSVARLLCRPELV